MKYHFPKIRNYQYVQICIIILISLFMYFFNLNWKDHKNHHYSFKTTGVIIDKLATTQINYQDRKQYIQRTFVIKLDDYTKPYIISANLSEYYMFKVNDPISLSVEYDRVHDINDICNMGIYNLILMFTFVLILFLSVMALVMRLDYKNDLENRIR